MVQAAASVFPPALLAKSHLRDKREMRVSREVVETVALDPAAVYARLRTRAEGLTSEEAAARLAEHGPNVLAKDARPGFWSLLWHGVRNPLVALLAVLANVQAMSPVNATALRDGAPRDVPVAHLVPGDVVRLTAGDMIPGDVRFVQTKDLFVIQGSLTGESFPVEKFVVDKLAETKAPLELLNIAFLGTSVGSGAATAIVIATGKDTYLGGMAEAMQEQHVVTAFDRGIAHFTWLMLGFMAVMVPLVFVINGVTKGSWGEAFFFAVAVAVGLTPEMLPMIVTICLSKGAVAMGKKKVIVKRINAIQNLGAMDVLCTDKTGTLTMDEIILERHCDVKLREDEEVLALAYINSHFQTGLKNVLDRAVLAHEESHAHARVPELAEVDEIPFAFERRIMSVVVRTPEGK